MDMELILYLVVIASVVVLILAGICIYNKYKKRQGEVKINHMSESITPSKYKELKHTLYADKRGIWMLGYMNGKIYYQLIPKELIKEVLREEKEDK